MLASRYSPKQPVPLLPVIRIPRATSVLLVTLLLALGGTPAAAQLFPAFAGLELRAGGTKPEDANLGYTISVDADLGYFFTPYLRIIAGGNVFGADFDQDERSGSFTGVGARVGARIEPYVVSGVTPYALVALTGHNISTSGVADPNTEDLLEGFNTGLAIGIGGAYALDAGEHFAATAELRHVFQNNFGRTALEVGFRYLIGGRDAYRETPESRTFGSDRQAEAERLRAERERLAAERERERLAADEARSAGAAETDAARREAAEQRRRAEQLEAEREREAEARRAAEEQAASASARADAAEQRMAAALRDLDRLIGNITSVRESERGLVVTLGQGLFATGQYTLSAQARSEVGRIAAVLTQYPERSISLEGHTDAVGSEESNQILSEQRAESVRAALIAEGVDPDRTDVFGYGESRPIATNTTASGRAENRRVEIVILGASRPS